MTSTVGATASKGEVIIDLSPEKATEAAPARSSSAQCERPVSNAPHARFDCVAKPFRAGPAARRSCPNCCCWVCDTKVTECKDWKSHSKCDGSASWVAERAKLKRQAEAAFRARQQGKPAPNSEEVRARFAQAAEAAAAQAAAPSREQEEERAAREQHAADEEQEDLFTEYEPRHYREGQPHPDSVVETTSLAFAELPPVTYTLLLPRQLMMRCDESNTIGGALSRLQLETVVYANQCFEQILPSGERAGFFLGDGVGLGKGRQLAGIIRERWLAGARRHLWVSVSADLMHDAIRDLTDIGAKEVEVQNLTKMPYGKLEGAKGRGFKEGVLYSTYAALVSQSRQGSRLDQIIEWLGAGDANGCIMFDESHKAKNLFPDSTADANAHPLAAPKKNKSTKTALAVHELQSQLPSACVVYCSATGASSLANMAYMSRLGLWGASTAFADFGQFCAAIKAGGVGAMELVALDMKRRGMYISRQLSFKSAEFETDIIDLTPKQLHMYDAASAFWKKLFSCFMYAKEKLHIGANGAQKTDLATGKTIPHPSAHVMMHFWACHQRFFRAMCMAMKVPHVVKLTQAALAENKCVIIGLQTTGESRLNDAVKSGEDLEEFTCMKEVLKFLISKFPTGDFLKLHPQFEAVENSDGEADLDKVAGEQSRKKLEKSHSSTFRRRRSHGSDDECEGEEDMGDMDGFVVGGGEEESESESEEADDDLLDSQFSASKGKLPKAVRKLPMRELRELLRLAKMPDQNCTTRPQLLSRLKQVGARSLQGACSLGVLLTQLRRMHKRPSPDQPRDGERGRPKRRLQTASGAVHYVVSDDEMDSGEEDVDVGSPGQKNGLLGRSIQISVSKQWRTAKVIDFKASSGKHLLEFGGRERSWLQLKKEKWQFAVAAAPGQAGRSGAAQPVRRSGAAQPVRRTVHVLDSEDDFENTPLQLAAQKGGKESAPIDLDSPVRPFGDLRFGMQWPAAKAHRPDRASAAKTKATGKKKRKTDRDDGSDDDSVVGVELHDEERHKLLLFQCKCLDTIRHLCSLKRQLLKALEQLEMPDNPLDTLIIELGGPSQVAELTGRQGRLVREGSTTLYRKRNDNEYENGHQGPMDTINLSERKKFMDGDKLVAIISEAASTGISLQADRRVPNRRRRVHITLELPWSADQCIQQCGRSHRANQVHGPQYRLLMTACGGERRFASTVAKRLQALGALTKGDRRAADSADLSAFDVDTDWGRKAMNDLLDCLLSPEHAKTIPPPKHVRDALGIKPNKDTLQRDWSAYLDEAEEALTSMGIDRGLGGVKQLLNRLLGVPVQMQNRIFAHFSANLDTQVQLAKESDDYDEGVVDIRGQSVSLEPDFPKPMAFDERSKVALEHFKLGVDRGVSFERAEKMLKDKAANNEGGVLYHGEGIYSRTYGNGRQEYVMLLQEPPPPLAQNPIYLFKTYRPPTGLERRRSTLEDLTKHGRFTKIKPAEAMQGWTQLYEDGLRFCSHGPSCNRGSRCASGKRKEIRHVLCGSVLPYWSEIHAVVGDQSTGTRDGGMKLVSKMKIVRVRVDDENGKELRLVGVEVSQTGAHTLLRDIGAAAAAALGDVKPDEKSKAKPDAKPHFGGSHMLPNAAPRPGASAQSSDSSGRVASLHDAGPPLAKAWRTGAMVRVQGLQGAKQFNGSRAKILGWDADSSRWRITVSEGQHAGTELFTKQDHLRLSQCGVGGAAIGLREYIGDYIKEKLVTEAKKLEFEEKRVKNEALKLELEKQRLELDAKLQQQRLELDAKRAADASQQTVNLMKQTMDLMTAVMAMAANRSGS